MPTAIIDSPVGPVSITEANGRIIRIRFGTTPPDGHGEILDRAVDQMRAYFSGELFEFDLPLAPPATPFQAAMRAAMLAIPYGQMRTYGDLAAALDTNARAIGQGCGDNPLPIVVPCHRVVAAGGRLGGFSGGKGRETKRRLLNFEAVHAP